MYGWVGGCASGGWLGMITNETITESEELRRQELVLPVSGTLIEGEAALTGVSKPVHSVGTT